MPTIAKVRLWAWTIAAVSLPDDAGAADSLPDRFGAALIDAWLATQSRTPASFDAVARWPEFARTADVLAGMRESIRAAHGPNIES